MSVSLFVVVSSVELYHKCWAISCIQTNTHVVSSVLSLSHLERRLLTILPLSIAVSHMLSVERIIVAQFASIYPCSLAIGPRSLFSRVPPLATPNCGQRWNMPYNCPVSPGPCSHHYHCHSQRYIVNSRIRDFIIISSPLSLQKQAKAVPRGVCFLLVIHTRALVIGPMSENGRTLGM